MKNKDDHESKNRIPKNSSERETPVYRSEYSGPGMKNHLTSWLRNNLGLVVLLLVSFLIYAPSLSGDFVYDDVPVIKDNPYIHGTSHFADFFSRGLWANTALENNAVPMYRPLFLVFHTLNHGLWGSNPVGYHASLLLLHMANILLVYALARKLTAGSTMAATVGAAIFALHPARVESVAWISGITDPLVTFFLLGALLAHKFFTESKNEWRYLALSLFCFQMALWNKEVAIVFPLIVVAHDLIYRKKINWLAVALHILLAAGYLVTRSIVLGATGKWSAIDLSHFSRAVDLMLGYSELLVFPLQIPLYIQPPEHAVSSALGVVGAIAIVTFAVFSWRIFDADRKKAFAFSAIWVIGFSWQAILLMFYMEGYYAARYLYIPAAGLAIFAAAFYDQINATYPRLKMLAMTSCALIVAFYGFFTWEEIPGWHDDGAVYGKAVKFEPEGASGYCGVGQFYFTREDYAPSEKNFLLCLQKAKANDVKVDALIKLGTIQGMANNLDLSENYLKELIRIDPRNSDGLAGLGNLALMRGQIYEAISFYEKALSARPGNHEAAMNLAMAYERTGQLERAEMIRRTIH